MSTEATPINAPSWFRSRNVSTQELAGEAGPAGTAVDARFEWLRAWVAIAIVIVAVVAVFLIAIGNSLVNIDNSLKTVDSHLKLVGGDVNPLPDYIQGINTKLTGIDAALAPIPGRQATSRAT